MDLIPRGSPTHIAIPKRAISVTAGGHHSVVLTHDGEVYTFGNHSKGQLGREPSDEIPSTAAACSGRTSRSFIVDYFAGYSQNYL
jgi:alpha-tubulin suppressor-like RCC1 family protein